MSNYPLGAENNPKAPYNSKIETFKFAIDLKITIHKDVTGASEEEINEYKEYLKEDLKNNCISGIFLIENIEDLDYTINIEEI